jgi:zinc and cadmium transporter
MQLTLIIGFCLLGSVFSVLLAGGVLLIKQETRRRFTFYAVSYATGTLLGAAFLGLIPHAVHHLSVDKVLPAVLVGLILFYLLEKLAVWRHCHNADCEVHSSAGLLILMGDSLHNFVDGVAIAAAFAGSVELGIATSIAVIAHEVPQEVGDFAILLESGYSRRRAFAYNMLSSLFALLGAILAYFLLTPLQGVVPYLMALSGASFIYIALADLVPSRRHATSFVGVACEFALMVLGIATIAFLHMH